MRRTDVYAAAAEFAVLVRTLVVMAACNAGAEILRYGSGHSGAGAGVGARAGAAGAGAGSRT